MTSLRRAFGALMLIVVTLGLVSAEPRPARADTSTAIYDDLKDVIAQLVERRVANGAADFLERASPALRFYLKRTIDRVRHDQWSAIKDALLGDLSDIVGDYTFWALMDAGGTPSFAKFVGCFEPVEVRLGPRAVESSCDSLRRRAAKNGETLFHERCQTTDPERRDGVDLSCDVAAMMRAALLGHVDEGSTRLTSVTIAAAAFLSPSFERSDAWGAPDAHGHHSALTRVLTRYAEGKQPEWLTRDRPAGALKDFLADCLGQVDPTTQRASFPHGALLQVSPGPPAGGDKMSALLCLNAWAPLRTNEFTAELDGRPVAVNGNRNFGIAPRGESVVAVNPDGTFGVPPGEDDPPFLEPEMRKLLSSAFQGIQPAPKKPGVVTVRFGRMRWRSTDGVAWTPVEGSPSLLEASAVVSALRANQKEADALSKFVEADLAQQSSVGQFKCDENCPFEVMRLGAQLHAFNERNKETKTIEGLAADVETALRLLRSHSGELDQIQTVYAQSKASKVPGKAPPAVLQVVGTIQSVDTGSAPLSGVPAVVRTIVAGERAAFATAVLRVALADVIDGPNAETGPSYVDQLYGAFIVNFVNYLLADKLGTPEESVRDGFRVSAARLLDGLSSSDGYYRSGFAPYPVVSLRFSWNPGYFSATSGDGFRYIASVDWPAVRTRFGPYVAVQFSMLDFAAPLAELALRKPVGYGNQGLVLVDAIRPRLSLMFGIPQITRNVVATVGISARLLAVCGPTPGRCDPPKDPPPNTTLTYRTTFSDTFANDQIPEVNLGVSYVF